MVENYTKGIKESVYHGAVVSALAVGYTMLGKTLIKMISNLSEEISKSYEKYVNVIQTNGNNVNINDAGDNEHCWLV